MKKKNANKHCTQQVMVIRGQGGKVLLKCHRVSTFSEKGMDQRLNTYFSNKKATFLPEFFL